MVEDAEGGFFGAFAAEGFPGGGLVLVGVV